MRSIGQFDQSGYRMEADSVTERTTPGYQPESYVDAKEGAAFLSIHPKTLMRLAREGAVPAYSFSEGTRRHWRFLISELDTWMRSRVNSNAHPVRSVSPGRRK
jgi:excisionase family DNA binding protein